MIKMEAWAQRMYADSFNYYFINNEETLKGAQLPAAGKLTEADDAMSATT